MKILINYSVVILFAFVLLACGGNTYNVENYIKPEDQAKNLAAILPYIAKLERGVNYENRFDTSKTAYFVEQQSVLKYSIERYFITTDSTHYFLICKKAPSLYEKKLAIGGRYKKDKAGKIYAFEELFNTPKMKLEELKEKSFPLFNYMVENGNVDKFIGDYLLIEFPDHQCVYDKEKCRWVIIDPLSNPLFMKDAVTGEMKRKTKGN